MEILIVEDEREIAQIIQECLEAEGFCCRVCYDGYSALRVFAEQQPDLIILDLRLPGMDGLEVCTQIRQKPVTNDPYILMLTSRGEEIDLCVSTLLAIAKVSFSKIWWYWYWLGNLSSFGRTTWRRNICGKSVRSRQYV